MKFGASRAPSKSSWGCSQRPCLVQCHNSLEQICTIQAQCRGKCRGKCRRSNKVSQRVQSMPIQRRQVLLGAGVPICGCGTCLGPLGRQRWYDRYFAWSMAEGMRSYENDVSAIKRLLFAEMASCAHGARQMAASETSGSPEGGRELRVLELGIGTGPNLAYYVSEVSEVVGVDPNPFMFEYALSAATAAGLRKGSLSLLQAAAEALPFEPASFDAVVCTLTLCSVEDPAAAVAEVRRVLKPGCPMAFLEHIQADGSAPLLYAAQVALDPLQQLFADGCHLTRRTDALIEEAGFASVDIRRFQLDAGLISPHMAGLAIA